MVSTSEEKSTLPAGSSRVTEALANSSISEKQLGPTSNEQKATSDSELPPQDGGRGAWMFLFGAAIVEITAWGMFCPASS